MALSHSPSIVTDGLVLCLDAANKRSYPGTGTTWTDLSGNGNNGTLTNGPTFSAVNSGSIVFDGTNDRIDCGTSFNTVITGTNNFTVSCWVYPENSQNQYADIWGNHIEPYKGIVCQQNFNILNQYSVAWGTGTTWAGNSYFNLITRLWNHLCFVRNGSSSIVYLNGIVTISDINSTSISPNTDFNFQIGIGYNLTSSRFFNGKISNFNLYNRALTANEVRQNYNATRGRFI